jgi:hypothetical protein
MPNEVVNATSAASRPTAINTRPMRAALWRASNVHQRSSRYASNQALKSIGLGWAGYRRDYSDVPPTIRMMKGSAQTPLRVRVPVSPSEAVLPPEQEFAADEEWSRFLENNQELERTQAQQQQQQ